MKRRSFLIFALVFTLAMCFGGTAYADQPEKKLLSQTMEYIDTDSYVIISIYEDVSQLRASTKSGSKNYDYYESGSLTWRFTVYGTFEYTGSSATCTAASYGCNLYSSAWSKTAGGAYRVGASAKATGTMTRSDGYAVYPNVTLTCSGSGVLS